MNKEKPKEVEKIKEEVNWTWSQREQKLARRITVSEKFGEGKCETVKITIYDKNAAIKVREMFKTQCDRIQTVVTDGNRLKGLFEKMKQLPYYKEIIDVLDALRWDRDKNFKGQLEQAEKDLKIITEDYGKIKKVLPVKL